MRNWLFITALVVWALFILNIQTVSNMMGFATTPSYIIDKPTYISTPAELMDRATAIRENILTYFPDERTNPSLIRPVDSVRVFRVRKALIENSLDIYYSEDRLSCAADKFFEREREALLALMQLACIIPTEVSPSHIYSDVRIVTKTKQPPQHFKDIGYITCNYALREVAMQAIHDLMNADRLLAQATNDAQVCREDEIRMSMLLAEENIGKGDLLAELNNYASACRKSLSCVCK